MSLAPSSKSNATEQLSPLLILDVFSPKPDVDKYFVVDPKGLTLTSLEAGYDAAFEYGSIISGHVKDEILFVSCGDQTFQRKIFDAEKSICKIEAEVGNWRYVCVNADGVGIRCVPSFSDKFRDGTKNLSFMR